MGIVYFVSLLSGHPVLKPLYLSKYNVNLAFETSSEKLGSCLCHLIPQTSQLMGRTESYKVLNGGSVWVLYRVAR